MTETLEDQQVEDTLRTDALRLIDDTMRDISGTTIVSTSVMLDILLDIRGFVDKFSSN
jgi:hypothetical protein